MGDRQMRMLFITEKFPPSEGGSRIYYYNLCKNYPAGNVVVLTKKVDGWESFDQNEKLKIIRKGRPLPNWKYTQIPKMFLPLLWTIYLTFRERVDVIHCGDFFPAGVIGLIMKKFFGKPYVYYVHGEGYTWFAQFRFQPKVRKVILRNADRIVAACSYAEEGVLRDLGGGQEKIVRINPGVEFERFDPNRKDRSHVAGLDLDRKKIILTVGRLIDRKGQDTVIRAMPKVIANVPEALYLICGRGPYEEGLRHLAADLGVDKNVMFYGFVPNDRLPDIYSICDLFVMINRDTPGEGPEGFGMVFTEAAAAGKAVIGGRSGGNKDSIVDGVTGYRVDPLDVDEVAAKIIMMLRDDNLRKTMGQNSREWVMKNFNWKDKALQIENLNQGIFGPDTRSSSCGGEGSKC